MLHPLHEPEKISEEILEEAKVMLTRLHLFNQKYGSDTTISISASDMAPFSKETEDLIKQLVHCFQCLLSSHRPGDLGALKEACHQLTMVLCKLSDCLVDTDPGYLFFHNNKSTMATLCLYAFGLNPLKPTDSPKSLDMGDLSHYLQDYLYSLSLVQRNDTSINPSPTNPSIKGEIDLHHLKTAFPDARITFKDFPGKFACDNPKLIWDTAYNLCTNAIKYGNGAITFSITADSHLVCENDAKGPISAEGTAALEAAFTGHTSPANKSTHSSGKGLAALAHAGAKLTCLGPGANGRGASIRCEISGYRPLLLILIVDDERPNRNLLSRLLNRIEFTDYQVSIIESQNYDDTPETPNISLFLAAPEAKLIFADQNVNARLLGSDFINQLQAKEATFKAIFISALHDGQESPFGEAQGVMMSKPFDLRQLLMTLEQIDISASLRSKSTSPSVPHEASAAAGAGSGVCSPCAHVYSTARPMTPPLITPSYVFAPEFG